MPCAVPAYGTAAAVQIGDVIELWCADTGLDAVGIDTPFVGSGTHSGNTDNEAMYLSLEKRAEFSAAGKRLRSVLSQREEKKGCSN